MEVTKRESIVSVSLIAFMLILGVVLSDIIQASVMDSNEKYNKAIQIDEKDVFEYAMRTNVGNAFVYGILKAVDPVSYPEISGEYMRIKKTKECYTLHTREVERTRTVNGKTEMYYVTETYWTWDEVGSEQKECTMIEFLGVQFPVGKIPLPAMERIAMKSESSHIRYVYKGTPAEHTGTIFARLSENTISPGCTFIEDLKPQEAAEYMRSSADCVEALFWFFWLALTAGTVYSFCYRDNQWLE